MYSLDHCKGTRNHGNGKKSMSISIFIGIITISHCLSTRLESPARVSSQDSKILSDNTTGRMCNTDYKRSNFTEFTNPNSPGTENYLNVRIHKKMVLTVGLQFDEQNINNVKPELGFTAQTIQIINTKIFKINMTDDGYIAKGDRFVVECSTEQKIGVHYAPKLITPIPDSNEERVKEECKYPTTHDPYKKRYVWRKIIENAHKEDEGNYSCVMDDGSANPPTKTQFIRVFGDREYILNLSAEYKNITVNSGKTAKWVISIDSFPLNFTSVLRSNDGQKEIQATLTKIGGRRFKLEINRATLRYMGAYKLHVEHMYERKTLELYLTVKSPPILNIESDGPAESPINCMFGHTCTISCKVEANPPPESYWTWRKCKSTRSCDARMNVSETYKKQIEHGFISSIEFNGTYHGNYTCHAKNGQTPNEVSITKQIRIVDYPGTGPISIIKPEEVVAGDDLKLVCVVSKLDYDENITWVQAEETITKPVGLARFTTEESEWSRRNTLEIKNIQQSATGTYRCTTGGSSPKLEASYHLDVLSIASPQFLEPTNLNNSKISLKLGESKELICNVSGRPKPVVTWMWNEYTIHEWGNHGELKYSLSEDARLLLLKYVPAEAQGRFKCVAENRHGTVTAFLDVSITGSRTFSNLALAIIISLLLAVIICGTILARYKYQQGKMKRFLKEINQKGFYDGDVDKINPELSVSDQAYLLPYDKRFEFPSARLKFGIQLGAGAFGRVVKAEAIGILNAGQNTTVAVKMVKPDADESHFKALMSELKVMVHLGKHANVVNLLGACTKSLAKKKELFIIVEYCKYGSLLSYMHRNKRSFINQLDPARGKIDHNIERPNDRDQLQAQSTLHYAELTFMDSGYSSRPDENRYRALKEFSGSNLEELTNANGVTVQESGFHHVYSELGGSADDSPSKAVDSSSGPVTTDGTTKRRSLCGSKSQGHYRGDYQAREVQPIRTTDLLCWAFQISRGMEYLASRKVLHGDLAARNVLLDENKVVKICDFGMAKEMYKDYKYKKNTNGVPLPLKWMAIESVFSGIFSTQSDCWSFGVVLWELFTLGQTPYPSMEADAKFFDLLSEGYRMEKPKLAPCSMHNIMLDCWNQEPTERPTFSALVDRIGDMMEERLRKHYMDLNAPYMRNNQKNLMAGQTDYLLTMGKTACKPNNVSPSPKGKYQNVPKPKELDYLMPDSPPVSPLSPTFIEQFPISPTYETTYSGSFVHQSRLEAQNPLYGILNVSNSPEAPGEEVELHENNNDLNLQIKQRPADTKDARSSCGNSYTTEKKLLGEVVLKYGDYANVKVGDNGIRGVSNINYVSKDKTGCSINIQ